MLVVSDIDGIEAHFATEGKGGDITVASEQLVMFEGFAEATGARVYHCPDTGGGATYSIAAVTEGLIRDFTSIPFEGTPAYRVLIHDFLMRAQFRGQAIVCFPARIEAALATGQVDLTSVKDAGALISGECVSIDPGTGRTNKLPTRLKSVRGPLAPIAAIFDIAWPSVEAGEGISIELTEGQCVRVLEIGWTRIVLAEATWTGDDVSLVAGRSTWQSRGMLAANNQVEAENPVGSPNALKLAADALVTKWVREAISEVDAQEGQGPSLTLVIGSVADAATELSKEYEPDALLFHPQPGIAVVRGAAKKKQQDKNRRQSQND